MPRMRRLLADLLEDQRAAETGIAEVTREIEALAQGDDRARRLATIPGIGPLGATALVAAAADGRRFKKARDLAAWLGLVPRQHWTDRKTTLLGSSERGNAYIRRLLIHGARSCVMHLDRSRDRLGVWVDRLRGRMHVNKATVAPANEIARRVGGAHPTGRALPTGRCRSRVSRGASVGFTRLTEGWRNSRSARRKPVLRSGLRACRSFVGTAR